MDQIPDKTTAFTTSTPSSGCPPRLVPPAAGVVVVTRENFLVSASDMNCVQHVWQTLCSLTSYYWLDKQEDADAQSSLISHITHPCRWLGVDRCCFFIPNDPCKASTPSTHAAPHPHFPLYPSTPCTAHPPDPHACMPHSSRVRLCIPPFVLAWVGSYYILTSDPC